MKKILFFLTVFMPFFESVIVQAEEKTQATLQAGQEENLNLEQAVMEALESIKKRSPQVHEDALRVWKNFSQASKHINFTYRFWGRQIILWLKEEKKIAFQSEQSVGEVFKILWRKKLISEHAVAVLMVDAWSHLVYLEGVPSWEKSMEQRSPEGGMAPGVSSESKPKERAI